MYHIRKHMMSVCPNFSEVNFDILVKVAPARFFQHEVKFFVCDNMWDYTLGLSKYSIVHQNSTKYF